MHTHAHTRSLTKCYKECFEAFRVFGLGFCDKCSWVPAEFQLKGMFHYVRAGVDHRVLLS